MKEEKSLPDGRTLQRNVGRKSCFHLLSRKRNNEPLFFSLGTRFEIMAGIVIAIEDDDDSREIKMGDVAESAPLSKNDEGDADRFAL